MTASNPSDSVSPSSRSSPLLTCEAPMLGVDHTWLEWQEG